MLANYVRLLCFACVISLIFGYGLRKKMKKREIEKIWNFFILKILSFHLISLQCIYRDRHSIYLHGGLK